MSKRRGALKRACSDVGPRRVEGTSQRVTGELARDSTPHLIGCIRRPSSRDSRGIEYSPATGKGGSAVPRPSLRHRNCAPGPCEWTLSAGQLHGRTNATRYGTKKHQIPTPTLGLLRPAMSPDLVTLPKAGRILRLSDNTIYRMVANEFKRASPDSAAGSTTAKRRREGTIGPRPRLRNAPTQVRTTWRSVRVRWLEGIVTMGDGARRNRPSG